MAYTVPKHGLDRLVSIAIHCLSGSDVFAFFAVIT